MCTYIELQKRLNLRTAIFIKSKSHHNIILCYDRYMISNRAIAFRAIVVTCGLPT